MYIPEESFPLQVGISTLVLNVHDFKATHRPYYYKSSHDAQMKHHLWIKRKWFKKKADPVYVYVCVCVCVCVCLCVFVSDNLCVGVSVRQLVRTLTQRYVQTSARLGLGKWFELNFSLSRFDRLLGWKDPTPFLFLDKPRCKSDPPTLN